jgi:tetratricopeptide (TPR) repeat protein
VHPGFVLAVAFSPDGKSLATGCSDKTMRLWSTATGEPIGPPLPQSAVVLSVAFSPDGKTLLAGCNNHVARLWDATTGQPVGPPLPHPATLSGGTTRVAFSPDGRFLLTWDFGSAWLWDTPPALPDGVRRLIAWVEVATALELDERGSVHVLDRAAWLERRARLEQLGGPPQANPAPRLDPILFGGEPAARGDAWRERGDWDRAEAAYTEAVRVRPWNAYLWDHLACFYALRGEDSLAAATYSKARRRMPDEAFLISGSSLAQLWAGDRFARQPRCSGLLVRFRETQDMLTAYNVAWASALGPGVTDDHQTLIRLAESAVANHTDNRNLPQSLRVLAAVLYRAGRFEEALQQLEQAAKARGARLRPQDWAFFAMAHHQLGHRDEALRWLTLLRNYQPRADHLPPRNELEVRLLRSEAEALVLYGPAFPDDPFVQ